MNPALKNLRAQIKQCEQFLALCDRVKHLEKVQSELTPESKLAIEEERTRVLVDLEHVSVDYARFDATLNCQVRSVGAYEQGLLREQIRTAQVRMGVLKETASRLTRQIEVFDVELNNCERELEELYLKLEQFVQVEGFHPDTVAERLVRLRHERDELVAAKKSEVLQRSGSGPGEVQAQATGIFNTTDFFATLQNDIASAKSVEIVSPQLVPERARAIMPEFARLAMSGRSVVIYTTPVDEYPLDCRQAWHNLMVEAHKQRIAIVQRSGIEYNAVMIDGLICWEGTVSILGESDLNATMRRTVSSSHVRELRFFFANS